MIFRQLHEWMHALWHGDRSTHPSGTPKIEQWRQYPYEPEEHVGHERAATCASYGDYRVCYCRECKQHYRTLERIAKERATQPWNL